MVRRRPPTPVPLTTDPAGQHVAEHCPVPDEAVHGMREGRRPIVLEERVTDPCAAIAGEHGRDEPQGSAPRSPRSRTRSRAAIPRNAAGGTSDGCVPRDRTDRTRGSSNSAASGPPVGCEESSGRCRFAPSLSAMSRARRSGRRRRSRCRRRRATRRGACTSAGAPFRAGGRRRPRGARQKPRRCPREP